MRNQPLTGYLLHHKPYKESRAIYYFFSRSHGVIHGVGKKGMPLFTLIDLFASGTRSLKTFNQIQPASIQVQLSPLYPEPVSSLSSFPDTYQTPIIKISNQLTGQNLYAGFYLNEILWRLLVPDDALPYLWHTYQFCISSLNDDLSDTDLRLVLRHFEQVLFSELGCSINYREDIDNNPIDTDSTYKFSPEEGFSIYNAPPSQSADSGMMNSISSHLYSGQEIFNIFQYLQNTDTQMQVELLQRCLSAWSRLHKQKIDHLVEYKPLESRELWKQFLRYKV